MRLERRWIAFGGLAVLVLGAGMVIGALVFSGKSSDSRTALSAASGTTIASGTTTSSGTSTATPIAFDTSSGSATSTPVAEPSHTANQAAATNAPLVTTQVIVITLPPDQPTTSPPTPPLTSQPTPVRTQPPTSVPTPAPTSTARCTELYVYYLRSALNPLTPEQFRQVCVYMGTDCLGIYVEDYLPIALNPSQEQFKQLCDFMGTDCLRIYVAYLRDTLNPLTPTQFKQQLC